MENRMNRNDLIAALQAAQIEIPHGTRTVAEYRRLFADNRLQVEAVLVEKENETNTDDENVDDNEPPQNQNRNDNAPPPNENADVQQPNPNGNEHELLNQNRNHNVPPQNENVDAQQQNRNGNEQEPLNQNRNVPPPQLQQTEDDALERELANLRRRHEILRLQREIERMERGEFINEAQVPAPIAATVVPMQANVRKIHFYDIEHAIVKFSGEDRTYSVNDFFRHLDQVFQ